MARLADDAATRRSGWAPIPSRQSPPPWRDGIEQVERPTRASVEETVITPVHDIARPTTRGG